VSLPWPPGAATGVGSLPGTDPREAARLVLGELPDLPFLPELPARGAHADLAGHGLALLADLPVDLQPSGWRLVPRAGRDSRRAQDLLQRDLDAIEEAAQTAPPVRLKVQAPGPWTLSTLVELPRGDRVLGDSAAGHDLAASLAEGLRLHLADLGRRLPGTELLLQLDEPSLPAVLAGRVPSASGFGRLRTPGEQEVTEVLRSVLQVAPSTVVHCCAPRPPVGLLAAAGPTGLSLDATVLTPYDDDAVGEAVEAGVGLLLGVLPGTDGPLSDLDARIAPVKAMWGRLGLDSTALPGAVVVTPACGLAGATPDYARAALAACVEIGRRLHEAPE